MRGSVLGAPKRTNFSPARGNLFDMDSFTAALKAFPPAQRKALLVTLESVESLFPHARRDIAWGMPTLKIGDENLCHVMGFKNHNSLFPSSGSVAEVHAKELKGMVLSKGTIHFDLDKPFPKPLLKKLLLTRIKQINASYPKKNGLFVEFYDNGGVKAKGKMKGSNPHGKWEFYRLDGSLMRSGSFKDGEQSGEWATFAADGRLVKTTNF